MSRPKGSKNKPRTPKEIKTLEQISAAKEAKAADIESLTNWINVTKEEIMAEIKAKKAELKKAQKEYAKLEVEEAKAIEAEAIAKRKADAEKVVAAMLESGKSVDDVLAILNQ